MATIRNAPSVKNKARIPRFRTRTGKKEERQREREKGM